MEITVSIVERRWTVFVMAEYIEREAAIKLIAEDKVEITPILCAITPTYTAEQAFDGLNQSCDRHIKFINSIPSADVQPVKWIPVNEELPTLYHTVLISGRMKYSFEKEYKVFVDVGCLIDEDPISWEMYNDWHEGQEEFAITHWMPLPEPPKDGKPETTYYPPINWCGEELIGDY